MAWLDNTGLYQKYGTEQTVPNNDGEYKVFGELREIEFAIDLTTLTEGEVIQSDQVFFPIGMKLEQVEIFVDTAAATGVAIDMGFMQTNRSSEIDADGILAALPTASMTLGAKLTLKAGDTYAGARVGGTNGTVAYVTCSRTTATAFTAGKIRVRLKYSRA